MRRCAEWKLILSFLSTIFLFRKITSPLPSYLVKFASNATPVQALCVAIVTLRIECQLFWRYLLLQSLYPKKMQLVCEWKLIVAALFCWWRWLFECFHYYSRCLSIELEMSMWARRGRIAAVIPSPSGVDSWGMKPPTHNFFSRVLFRDCCCWHCTYGCVCEYVHMYTCVHMYCLLLLSYKGCWCNNAVALLSNLTNEPMGLSNSWQKYFFLLLFLNLVRSL